MKVAMVGPYPEPGIPIRGGVERVIDTIIPELARSVDLTLFVPGSSRNFIHENHGVRTVYLKRAPGPGALRYWSIDALKLAKAVHSYKPDIVHIQGVAGAGLYINIPQILTVHGIVEKDLLASGRGKNWGRQIQKAASAIVARAERKGRSRIKNIILISEYVKDVLPSIKSYRQFNIPNPLDPYFIGKHCDDHRTGKKIISVGSIIPRKNTLELIKIAKPVLLDDSEAQLTICGSALDQSYLETCKTYIKCNGIENRVRFTGNLTVEQLQVELADASCFLMASKQETAPVAICEANACGVPALTPRKFGMKYMIQPGFNGFFLPDGDLEAQSKALHQTLNHSWDRSAIATHAQKTYSVISVVEQTMAAYRVALGLKK